jgi:nicotinic acid mononucleotide adenylyltransferase
VKRVAFFGGSFNPPHIGHASTILTVMETANVNGVMVAPVFKHPDGKVLLPFDDRLRLCWEAFGIFRAGHCPVWVDSVERRAYAATGSGFTCDTLRLLLNEGSYDQVVLVAGGDIDIGAWTGGGLIQEMIAQGRVEIFQVPRTGYISSTIARERIARGAATQHILPARVRTMIDEKGWYK